MRVTAGHKRISVRAVESVTGVHDVERRAERIVAEHRKLAGTAHFGEQDVNGVILEDAGGKVIASEAQEQQTRVLDLRQNPNWSACRAEEAVERIIRHGRGRSA